MSAKVKYAYDKDFYAWTIHNAELIRQGKFSEIDKEHVAEELESMGKNNKREFINCLALLIAYLLDFLHNQVFWFKTRHSAWEQHSLLCVK